MPSQIPNTKHQITNKFQIPKFNDPNMFGIVFLKEDVNVWNFETEDPLAGWGVQAKREQFWLL
jgi:hypothetical protein